MVMVPPLGGRGIHVIVTQVDLLKDPRDQRRLPGKMIPAPSLTTGTVGDSSPLPGAQAAPPPLPKFGGSKVGRCSEEAAK